MREVWLSPKWLIRGSSIAVLWLLFVSVGYAAPAPRHRVAGRVCVATAAASPRKLARHLKSFGGPVARPSTRAIAGLPDSASLIKRTTSTRLLGDDDEAIQNDAPAAQIDTGDSAVPDLQPLELLHRSSSRVPRTRAFSPRSPRGPPAATA